MELWAEKEIELACARERADSDAEASCDWDYGCACYESAFKAFKSLLKDRHSGCSIGFTKNILIRLIDQKPLTPIEDIPEVWNEVNNDAEYTMYQCKRMSALFKYVYKDGTVKYKDIDSHYCVDIANPDITYHSGLVQKIMDELFPITMPYMPPSRPSRVYCREYLVDPKNGDFDTVGVFYLIQPDGTRIEINQFFKESDESRDWIKITKKEFLTRKALYENRINLQYV